MPRPLLAILENVEEITSSENIQQLHQDLADRGYVLGWTIANSKDYLAPTARSFKVLLPECCFV